MKKKVMENQTDKKILFIVGKTSSGKDTVANYLSEKYDVPHGRFLYYKTKKGIMKQMGKNIIS